MTNTKAQKRQFGQGALGRMTGGRKAKTELFYFITLFKNMMSFVAGSWFKRQTLK